jgi:hypothetical protein
MNRRRGICVSTPAPSAWSEPVLADPLQLHSPAGSVLDLQAAPAGQALSLPEGHTLTGSGVWAGPLINSGVVAPGESPGVLSVQSFEQASGATLKVEIGGTTAGAGQSNPLDGHDQVAVSGQARLAGILSLDFINDFRPSAGQVFDVMTWNSRQGSFSSYTGLYAGHGIYLKPIYQADRLRLWQRGGGGEQGGSYTGFFLHPGGGQEKWVLEADASLDSFSDNILLMPFDAVFFVTGGELDSWRMPTPAAFREAIAP